MNWLGIRIGEGAGASFLIPALQAGRSWQPIGNSTASIVPLEMTRQPDL